MLHKLADARRRERLGGNGLPNDPSLGDDIEGDARNLVRPEAAAQNSANMGKLEDGSLQARQGWQSVETQWISQENAGACSDDQGLEIFTEKLKCACNGASTENGQTKLGLAKVAGVTSGDAKARCKYKARCKVRARCR